MPDDLFIRTASIRVDTIGLVDGNASSGLRVVFSINKSLKIEPNKTRVDVFNLSPDHRRQLEELETVPVEVKAGYQGDDSSSILFQGNLRRLFSRREGADIITTIEAGDGEKTHQTARVNQSFPAGTKVSDILRALVKTLDGIGPGNALDEQAISFLAGGNTIAEAITINGNAARELYRMVKAFGFEVSYQGEALQILKRGRVLQESAVKLDSNQLVGSPSVDNKGILKCSALIQPGLNPGRKLVLDGEFLKGNYRIEKTDYSGDTHGDSWEASIEASKL